MASDTVFSFVNQTRERSSVNKAFASMLCTLLQNGEYQYSLSTARDVSYGMVYEGDILCCNCIDDRMHMSDHPLNLFAKFCPHKDDLFVMNIHSSFDLNTSMLKDSVYNFVEENADSQRATAFIIEHEKKSDCSSQRIRALEDMIQWISATVREFHSISPIYFLHRCQGEEKISLLSPLDSQWVRVTAETVEMIFDYNSWRF